MTRSVPRWPTVSRTGILGVATLALTLAVTACGSGSKAVPPTTAANSVPTDETAPATVLPVTVPVAPETTLTPPPVLRRSPSPVTPLAPPLAVPAPWKLGATPLPKGPDGKPLVLPTPEALRDRRLTTTDRLPPPPAGAPYASTTSPIDAAIAARMGTTWQPGCPVGLGDLRYLTLSFWGFDGQPHTGELVVNTSGADDVQKVFGRLFAARFPLEEVRLVEPADIAAEPTGDGNTTAAFVCRLVRGSTSTFSAHASGLAIDINPFQNPYTKGASLLPELASAYLDRSWNRPGMIRPGDLVTRAFAEVGWTWGGNWKSTKDTMHFSANGR